MEEYFSIWHNNKKGKKNNESEEKSRQGSSINNRSLMIYMQNQQLHLFSIYSCVIMNSSIYILVFVQLWLLSLPCRESVCIPSERETLLKFKNNLNDPSNRLWSWNHNHTNCCHWYGVLCHNVTSHVLQLHLNSSPSTAFYRYYDGLLRKLWFILTRMWIFLMILCFFCCAFWFTISIIMVLEQYFFFFLLILCMGSLIA